VSRGTQAPDPPRPPPLVPTGLSPSLVGRPRPFGSDSVGMFLRGGAALRRSQSGPTTPPGPCCQAPGGLGCSRFVRHYCGNLLLMSRPRGTEMFQFPRCPSRAYSIQRAMSPLARRRVAPFGSARLIARLQLPWHVSPLSAPFFGPWPLRHPPATLLRLARLHIRATRAVCVCRQASRVRPLVLTTRDPTRSLRQNRSKSPAACSCVLRTGPGGRHARHVHAGTTARYAVVQVHPTGSRSCRAVVSHPSQRTAATDTLFERHPLIVQQSHRSVKSFSDFWALPRPSLGPLGQGPTSSARRHVVHYVKRVWRPTRPESDRHARGQHSGTFAAGVT
jgi:hypothetical protein